MPVGQPGAAIADIPVCHCGTDVDSVSLSLDRHELEAAIEALDR